ncbi:MAG: exodeoxyribonuclease V subunit gamma, partial [Verrucomicrobiota bacterium]|nr:exodeoxyribonuclease V subunit gamma [Verrucomicrobiota bacterium]
MAGLHVYRSNHLEALVDALTAVTRQPLRSVLEPEIVVVQSLGIRRWLSLELARHLGVTMNCEFPFPATFLQQILAAVLPDSTPARAFERHVLPWRILQRLAPDLDQPAFADLRAYLAGENRALKEYQLATRIAGVFDRYLAYRHRLILEWQGGAGTHWQAQLWRELAEGHERAHTPALAREFGAALKRDRIDRSALPTRVSLFGISSLPPFYVELFGAISSLLDVHLFLLTPTPEYWSDLRSPREQQRSLRKQKRPSENGALHFETGNLLLASLGRIGREFGEVVLSLDPLSEKDLCAPPAETTLLGHVQADLFYVRERAPHEKVMTDPGDRSIQLHCCHGPMREVEVLHDQLLDLFQNDPALTPRDILVTMPDVEVYAPFIEAVFGAAEDRRRA